MIHFVLQIQIVCADSSKQARALTPYEFQAFAISYCHPKIDRVSAFEGLSRSSRISHLTHCISITFVALLSNQVIVT